MRGIATVTLLNGELTNDEQVSRHIQTFQGHYDIFRKSVIGFLYDLQQCESGITTYEAAVSILRREL